MEYILVAIFFLAGVFTVLKRNIKSVIKTEKNDSLLFDAEKDLSALIDLIDSIDLTYKYFDAKGLDIEKTKESLQNIRVVNYKILKVLSTPNSLLIYTYGKYKSWDTGINGKATDVSKTTQDFFAIKYEALKNKILISGPMYNNAEEKFVYQEFANVLNECVKQ